VCTKSFDSARVAQDLASHPAYADGAVKFVLFQNGWGNAEVFAEHFAPERIYSARVITGFRRPRPNEVEVTVHADAIHIGSLYAVDVPALEDLCRVIHTGGIPCETTPDIGKDLWAKMLYNCALNPLGAILHASYGALAAHASTRVLMDNIIGEVFAVMASAGYGTHWETPEDFIAAFYERLVPATAEHKSSMLQDIMAGKRTEIEALNGAVIRQADASGVAVPHNRSVYNLVKFVESAH
jgi:2-dehydropantoate 2-reductase